MDGHAVVIGASIGGLAAARVLSRRYARVTVLDRDELPPTGVPRKGVPQGSHGHILLRSGLLTLDKLFPGILGELVEGGATAFDAGSQLCIHRYGLRWPAVHMGIEIVGMSRPMLESTIRRRVLAEPGVTVRSGAAVSALLGDRHRITGVLVDGEPIAADLVVDATGRGARSDRWLADLGLPAPVQQEIKIGVAYTTRLYERKPGQIDPYQAALIMPDPPRDRRSGLIVPLEGNRWLVSVGGWHVDEVPADEAEFEAYAKALPDPLLAELIAQAEPITGIRTIRYPASRRRRFEELTDVPGGYVTVGDAFCSFNPIYGQGMTCAANAAVALGEALDAHAGATGPAWVRDYYARAARVVAVPWQFAAGGDFVYPQTTGPRPFGNTLMNWYVRRLSVASLRSADLSKLFFQVQQLMTPPGALFKPSVLARVLAYGGGR